MNINDTQEAFAVASPFAAAADQLTRAIMVHLITSAVLDTATLLNEFASLYTGICAALTQEMPNLDALELVKVYRVQTDTDETESRFIRIGREVSDMMGGKERSINLLMTLLHQTADKIRLSNSDE